jgi:16S rRNA (uracil1498-N3)-methyltransferase
MHYFFREDYPLKGGEAVALSQADFNHAFRVLRLRSGEQVMIADGRGRVFQGKVIKSDPREILVLLEIEEPHFESPLKIVICPSLLKGEKMDLLIRQTVELGVQRIAPLVTERSIPQRDKTKEEKRLTRWRNIVRSSAAQCQRAYLPPVDSVRTITELIADTGQNMLIVPWEEDQVLPLAALALKEPYNYEQALFLLIGPEGGFSSEEIEVLKEGGAVVVNLGPRILRSDTAAAAAITLVQAAWGDFSRRVG